MNEDFDYDVFISYSNQDKAIVHPLAERLRDDGLKVWLDEWVIKPGDPISLKIQHGLEMSRVLLMCMSKAYFASDWTTLEHHTLLFRDPTNKQRRFVPLLLENCERPGVIAQFLHIDWRLRERKEFQKILVSCKYTEATPCNKSNNDAFSILNFRIASSVDPGLVIKPIIATTDNQNVISAFDGRVAIWDVAQDLPIEFLSRHRGKITRVRPSRDEQLIASGSVDGTVRVWNRKTQRVIALFEGHQGTVFDVAISQDGQQVISGSADRTLKLWDLKMRRLNNTLKGHKGVVTGVAIHPHGKRAISSSEDKTLKIWDLSKCCSVATLKGHSGKVFDVAISSSGQLAISAAEDSTLKIWDLSEQRLVATLEGHRGPVYGVAIHPDGRMAISASEDRTLRIWDLTKHHLTATLEVHSGPVNGVDISPNGKWAASVGRDGLIIYWDLQKLNVFNSSAQVAQYTNAKVVLIGESGAGKSGLALRLSENDWYETGSSHGMSVTKLHLPSESPEAEREVWLWDFAGQPDYRLIHQLYMDETALALMVVDPQKDEPFAPLGHWEQALSRAVKHNPEKLLVAARCDRGGYVVGQLDIDAYLKGRGYAGHVNTSAKLPDDPGCAKLKDLIAKHIPWDRLPSTSTTALFKRAKGCNHWNQGNRYRPDSRGRAGAAPSSRLGGRAVRGAGSTHRHRPPRRPRPHPAPRLRRFRPAPARADQQLRLRRRPRCTQQQNGTRRAFGR